MSNKIVTKKISIEDAVKKLSEMTGKDLMGILEGVADNLFDPDPYLQSGGDGDVCIDISEAIAGMLEKFEIVEQMFHGFMYKAFFKGLCLMRSPFFVE